MGARGPAPKRDDQRTRRNQPSVPTTTAPAGSVPVVPAPEASWAPLARDWFLSLAQSGQSAFYEASDWAEARFIAEMMSRVLKSERVNGQLVATILAGTTKLLTTEGDRRRVRIELERHSGPEPVAPKLAIMDGYRKAAVKR